LGWIEAGHCSVSLWAQAAKDASTDETRASRMRDEVVGGIELGSHSKSQGANIAEQLDMPPNSQENYK